ncbi:cytochrome-c peroxidase [bacterium endosymbiont of Bathymodiolus sp. 5 South]|jgi:cytochrome c peroxidase|uniref:cytochrome-c peroxidase n=1 Tax=bacterium endosymbiont of Bathymodiolus sp. 5 South TaxID=1181670 RepID=UPI0010B79261|nr:cytochrome c peroxidase [bacterium endosymbiont of Bathymodiolus sp. 5 South]CAC9647617.1 Cytochrome c551 peroxidase (EC 1.11.1.5) [uncultured Gammaproteobacteria bacterium]CAC9650808.1 Cytochrome c551 peroxidase (EC 1.11.1.5) [uncultured Gammaproteobacteria bacterium]SHN90780.1 Cytochrome c551 peroxidase [bacterium endosymbiont of Bathymodiolus sp. 5 South]SSC06992.1 Cytochrome c551 peroxidase [bacterium endosymbiont of Bathymodiolus sp. 5 South]VVH56513.1 Cytochrome c551 peroxidase (EC [u
MKLLFLFFILISSAYGAQSDFIAQKQALGEKLFFDPILSNSRTQSCSTCHNPGFGFVDNRDNGVGGAASLGDNGKSLGDRNTPSAAYAMLSPDFHFDKKSQQWIGGQFLDGREQDLKGQAGGPPLNPGEMNMLSKQALLTRFKNHPTYSTQFKKIYGNNIFDNTDKAYLAMTKSIAEFEKTKFFAPFDSKYDRYLAGKYKLTDLEDLGRSLFFSDNGANCTTCHQLKKSDDAKGEAFSNYEYYNIGVPVNTALRAKNGVKTIDKGLLNNPKVNDVKQAGKFKTPSLRNIAITTPYMHNGVFKELATVIVFHNKYIDKSRTTNPETNQPWAAAEVPETIDFNDLKKGKKLSDKKVNALVAFLKTLTDKRYEHLLKRN